MPEEDPQETALVERLVLKHQAPVVYALDQANPDPQALRSLDILMLSETPARREPLRRTVADLEALLGYPVSLSCCTPEEFSRESHVQGMRAYRAVKHGRQLWP
jgi:hypothetical protein